MTPRQIEEEPSPDEGGFVRCSVAEAARLLGVSESTVRNRIKSGILLAEREGQRWIVLLPRVVFASDVASDNSASPAAAQQVECQSDDSLVDSSELASTLESSFQPGATPSESFIEDPDQPYDAAVQNSQRPATAVHEQDEPTSGRRPWLSIRDLVLALALGLIILAIVDYFMAGDTIPFLAEAEARAGAIRAVSILPTSQASELPAATRPTPEPSNNSVIANTRKSSPPIAPTAPPASPTASPELPTATSLRPTQRPLAADVMLQRVAEAEAVLRAGEFEAGLDYGTGPQSLSRVRFDLGGEAAEARFHTVVTYESSEAVQTVERMAIDDRWWQRTADDQWTAIPPQEAPWGQIQAYLPRATTASEAEVEQDGNTMVLHWHDADRGVEVALHVDPATGQPREMQQTNRATGAVLTVTYRRWNTPVDITPPEDT